MVLFKDGSLTSYLATFDTKEILVETVFYNDKSYMNIHHSDGKGWFSARYCAFESEKDILELKNYVLGILNDYYDKVETVNHYVK